MEISVRSIAHAPRPVAYRSHAGARRAHVKLAAGFVQVSPISAMPSSASAEAAS